MYSNRNKQNQTIAGSGIPYLDASWGVKTVSDGGFFHVLKLSSKVGLKHTKCANGIPIMHWAPLHLLLFTFMSHHHCVLLKLDHGRAPEGPAYINKTKLP